MLKNYIEVGEASEHGQGRRGVARVRDRRGLLSAPWSLLLFQGTGANTLTGALTTGFTQITTAMAELNLIQSVAFGCPNATPPLRHAFDELDCSHSLDSGNPIVAICRNDRCRDTIDPK